jgi:hypothetical protein
MVHAGGRPLKFKTPKELEKKIAAYFKDCEKEEKPLSITGLALALDTSRETLCNYQARDEFFDAIKRAKLRVEQFYEERLTFSNAAGPIFALKNFDWSDKQDVNHSGGIMTANTEIPDDQKKSAIDAIMRYQAKHKED